jgi:hypothetical protein
MNLHPLIHQLPDSLLVPRELFEAHHCQKMTNNGGTDGHARVVV